MEETPTEFHVDLAALVELARTIQGTGDLAQAICALAVANLGLSGASISIVTGSQDQARLDSIAAVGQLSSFTLDLSTPLNGLTDAARTALDGKPLFVGNPHGITHDAEKPTGVSRWREGFGSHAYATLGLTVRETTFGVLILEWPEPRPFGDTERESLQLFADIAALALSATPAEQPAEQPESPPPPTPQRPTCDNVEVTAFQANSRGLVVPNAVARSWREAPTLRIWTASTPDTADSTSVAFAQVTGLVGGGITIVAGAVHAKADGDARRALATGSGVMGAAAVHGSPPQEVLGMLGSSIRGDSAWATGLAVALWPDSGALQIAEAGGAALLTLGPGGRLDVAVSSAQPVGASHAPPPNRMQLALPGDRIALLASDRIASLADPGLVAKAKRALSGLPEHGGEHTARSLLELMCRQGGTAAVALVEVVIGAQSAPTQTT